MLGPELAALLEPFAKWGLVVAGVLFVVWLVRFWIRQGAKAEEELESVLDGQKEERSARKSIKDRAAGMRDRLLARGRRVPHD